VYVLTTKTILAGFIK